MSLSQFLAIIHARWILAVVIWAVVVSSVLAFTFLRPKEYEATASVVIDVRPDPLAAISLGVALNPAVVATQVDIMRSERVALRVIQLLRLSQDPKVREQWQQNTLGEVPIESWLAGSLQKFMEVTPSRESNVIALTYTAQDAKFAAAMANAFAQAYLETAVELRVSPARQFSTFFDQRAKEAREALEKAQNRLSEFQRSKGIINADERLDVESARLNELSSQFVALQAIAGESRSRQVQAAGGAGERMAEVINNPVIGALRADLARQEARSQEINSKLGDAHPQVVELRANIAELRQRITAETRQVTGSVGVSNSINNQREAQVRAELEAQRAKVMLMKSVRDEASVLVRDAENAQRTYDAILGRLTQASLESQATQSNASILTQATPPSVASRPRVARNAALGSFLAVFLGVGVVVVRELIDRRLRVADDLAQALTIPVLGVMPKPGGKSSFAKKLLPIMEQRLLGLAGSRSK